jgi:hypothetical protein
MERPAGGSEFMISSLLLQVLQENPYPNRFLVLPRFEEFLPEEFAE